MFIFSLPIAKKSNAEKKNQKSTTLLFYQIDPFLVLTSSIFRNPKQK